MQLDRLSIWRSNLPLGVGEISSFEEKERVAPRLGSSSFCFSPVRIRLFFRTSGRDGEGSSPQLSSLVAIGK
jgi:hypothetical protein